MGIVKKLMSFLAGGAGRAADEGYVHREYVRCGRCGEKIAVRVDLRNELTAQYDEQEDRDTGYYWRKAVVGSGERRCFQPIEVELFFDVNRQLTDRTIRGGEFITAQEYYAQEEQGNP